MILQVGLDETGYGQTGSDEAFVFAGYVAPVSHIEAFTHLWDDILKSEPNLSAKRLKKLVRSRHSTDPRVKLLVETIRSCHLRGVRFKITHDDYAEFKRMLPPLAEKSPRARLFSNPYVFAFMALLTRLIGEIRNDPNAKIEVIYDENLWERKKLEDGKAGGIGTICPSRAVCGSADDLYLRRGESLPSWRRQSNECSRRHGYQALAGEGDLT